MVFNSYTFIFYFGIVFLFHYLPISWRIKKLNLVVASCIFYATWSLPFVLLVWVSTLVSWVLAKKINTESIEAKKKFFLFASILFNLSLLAYFKYADFLIDNFIWLLSLLHIQYQPAICDIILPIGISFYTFKTLTYTIDVYRKKAEPSDSLLDYSLYVIFFPQLLAGPIVRACYFLPQCNIPTKIIPSNIAWGFSLLMLGLFEKNVLADGLLAPVADKIFESNQSPDFISAWTGAMAFTGQIFCDFGGYSTCAIGVALCLGFETPINFRYPYAAIGFSDFWRRWHISLSSWFRDYVYIPMGGNRRGLLRTEVNLAVTMLLCGLWHGASWTFVVWGGLHGLYLLSERFIRTQMPESKTWSKTPVKILVALMTFVFVCFAWVFFRSKTFYQAFLIIQAMFASTSGVPAMKIELFYVLSTFVVILAMLFTHWVMRERALRDVAEKMPWWLRAFVLAALLIAIVTSSGDDRAFIYFQF